MTDSSIQAFQPSGGALSAEHYQTFELAKENDGILGGSDIAQIRSYAAYARAQAQAIHKTIAATSGIDDVAAIKAEATETAQTFAKVGIYADQRIGEILRELPTSNGGRPRNSSDVQEEFTKANAIQDAGISRSQAYDLQKMASNPEVVQAVLDKAEQDGTIPSRSQVLKAIRERDDARFIADKLKEQRDAAKEDAEGYAEDIKELQEEIAALEKEADKAYEDGYSAAQKHAQQPKEVVREVVPADTERRLRDLEHEVRIVNETDQKLRRQLEDARRELDRAKDILGLDKSMREVQSDVQYLIAATNQYVRRYGGLTWTVERLGEVDEVTREELRKAVKNLATFSSALMASLEEFNG